MRAHRRPRRPLAPPHPARVDVYYHEAMLARQGHQFRDLAGATGNFRAGHAAGRDSPFWPRRGRHHGVEGDATRFFAAATASSPLGGPESWLLGRVGWRRWPWVAWRQRAFHGGVHSISASPVSGCAQHFQQHRPAQRASHGTWRRGARYPSTVIPAEVSWAGRSDAQFQRVRTLQWCARGTKGADPARGRGPNTPNRRKVERPRGGGARFNALVRPYDPPVRRRPESTFRGTARAKCGGRQSLPLPWRAHSR